VEENEHHPALSSRPRLHEPPEDARHARILSRDDRALLRLRASSAAEKFEHYGGGLRELCGHRVRVDGDTPSGALARTWVLLHKIDGIWLIADLGSGPPPPACVSSGD
jgi:hypothetical protein